jgi:hypothetical protein
VTVGKPLVAERLFFADRTTRSRESLLISSARLSCTRDVMHSRLTWLRAVC